MIGSLQASMIVRSRVAQRQCARQHSGCPRIRLQLRTRPAAAQHVVSSLALDNEKEDWESFASNVSGRWTPARAAAAVAGKCYYKPVLPLQQHWDVYKLLQKHEDRQELFLRLLASTAVRSRQSVTQQHNQLPPKLCVSSAHHARP
jgi:hypothetical protein